MKPPVETELHAYLGGICNELECHVIKVGGYTDHIHIPVSYTHLDVYKRQV